MEEELVEYPICHELTVEDDIFDTEGMVNGGIGECCSQCLEDFDIRAGF